MTTEKTKTEKTEAKPKRRQLEIAGTERPRVKEVDAAAEEYVEIRDKRMKLTVEEKERKEKLIAVMQQHKLTFYEDLESDPPLQVWLVNGEVNVKVKKLNGDEEEAA